jgi:hypothetical protein
MLVYTFRSRRDTTLLALSIDKTGANLPEEHGPWESQGTPAMQVANGLGADAPARVCLVRKSTPG